MPMVSESGDASYKGPSMKSRESQSLFTVPRNLWRKGTPLRSHR